MLKAFLFATPAVLLMAAHLACAETLLVQTQGGTVSVIQDIPSAEKCDQMRLKLLGRPSTDEEREAEKKREAELEARGEEFCSTHRVAYLGSPDFIGFLCRDFKYTGRAWVGQSSPSDIKSAQCLK